MSGQGGESAPTLTAFPPRRIMRDEIVETLRAAVISGQLKAPQIYSAPILATNDVAATNRNAPHPYAVALYSDWLLSEEAPVAQEHGQRRPQPVS